MNQLNQRLVLCDLDHLLLGADGNLTQVVRDVLQLFDSRGGKLTVFSAAAAVLRCSRSARPGQCVPFWAVCGSMPLRWCAAARWPTILPMAPAGRCAALPGRTPICSPACRTQQAWASLCR